MKLPCGASRALFLVLSYTFVVIMMPCSASADTELRLGRIPIAGGAVDFDAQPCDASIPFPTESRESFRTQNTAHYSVLLDLRNIRSTEAGYTVYKFYVRSRPAPGSHPVNCFFLVQATPTGTFLDQGAEVHFQIGEGTEWEQGSIKLPIHNTPSSQDLLQGPPEDTVAEVRLGTDTKAWLRLGNRLADLPLEVDEEVAVNPNQSSLWKEASGKLRSRDRLTIPAQRNVDDAIELTLQPNLWKALGASFLPLGSRKWHDRIVVTLNYNTPGGFARTMPISIEVRFVPSLWSLLLAVFAGSLLGSLVPLAFSTGQQRTVAWLHAFGAACVVATIVWLVALVLVSLNSEFKVFGIQLDPLQIIPAALIGVFVGLYGFRSADAVREFFNRHWAPSSTT